VRWCSEAAVAPPRPRAVGEVREDGAEVSEEEDVRWRRSPAMAQRPTHGRKPAYDTEEEAGGARLGGPFLVPQISSIRNHTFVALLSVSEAMNNCSLHFYAFRSHIISKKKKEKA
jgi:hypothetical protein